MIPAGDPVLPEHQVANRDETIFDNGWELDFHRTDPAPHLSLSWGPHRCLGCATCPPRAGNHAARAVEALPELELTVSPEDIQWSPMTFSAQRIDASSHLVTTGKISR